MNTHRLAAWTIDPKDGAQMLSPAARQLVGLPCRMHSYTLRHGNAPGPFEAVKVDIFPRGFNQPQAVALIPPDAGPWVEPALRGLFNEDGEQVYGRQIDLRDPANRTETHAASQTAAPITA